MTPLLLLAVAAAGGVGAALRLLVDGLVRARVGARFPWATLVINVTGSLLLGVLTSAVSGPLLSVVGTGLLGGYTTFSTASYETVRLLQDGRPVAAGLQGVGGLVVCVIAAAAGLGLGALL